MSFPLFLFIIHHRFASTDGMTTHHQLSSSTDPVDELIVVYPADAVSQELGSCQAVKPRSWEVSPLHWGVSVDPRRL